MLKPFSQACINNRDAILEHLKTYFHHDCSVLEVGSGTGQHAVYFSAQLPFITWQTSDLKENHDGINQWLDEFAAENCLAPIELDVADLSAVAQRYDGVFTANTLHIMSWEKVVEFFKNVNHVLQPKGLLLAYGPFNYNGSYTSESNERFDQYLQAANPERGIRDSEKINQLAAKNHLQLLADHEMPANNRLLVWQLEKTR